MTLRFIIADSAHAPPSAHTSQNSDMNNFVHQRHRDFSRLERPRELVVACAPMRSNVNLSRIVRAAGSAGVRTVIVCGAAKIIDRIARDSLADDEVGTEAPGVEVRVHRTLPHVLLDLRSQGFHLVGLEQATGSTRLFDHAFARRTVLVVGNERAGLDEETLATLDNVVEIPIYGPPRAFNAATAATMAIYEYCRQFPIG